MELERGVVFTLAGLPVTSTVVTTWGMLVVLCAAAVLAGRRLRAKPSRWQAAVEWGVSLVQKMLEEVTVAMARSICPWC
jgi:F0F1-type ATP synthase membrane subunit a